ncbi:MAG: hypothetical protein QOD77_355 [Thermoplasmata archaeon]|jgi:hypothetical protein|nr:hypothetical protein [Thermoplasmata archaeon]
MLVGRGAGIVLALSQYDRDGTLLNRAASDLRKKDGKSRYDIIESSASGLSMRFSETYLSKFSTVQWGARLGSAQGAESRLKALKAVMRSITMKIHILDGVLAVEFHVDSTVAPLVTIIDRTPIVGPGLRGEMETHFLDYVMDVTALVHETSDKKFVSLNVFSIVSAFSFSGTGAVASENALFQEIRQKLRDQHHDNIDKVERFESEVRTRKRRYLIRRKSKYRIEWQFPSTLQKWITEEIERQRSHHWQAIYLAGCMRNCRQRKHSTLRRLADDMDHYAPLYEVRREMLGSLRDQIGFQLATKGLLAGFVLFAVAFLLAIKAAPFDNWSARYATIGFIPLVGWVGYWYVMHGITRSLELEIGKTSMLHSRAKQ